MRNRQFSGSPGGRRVSFGPGGISPFIKAMLIVNLAVWILQWVSSSVTSSFGLTPARFFSEFPNLFYQPVTYMFLHSTGSIGHILFNMFALWMFGTEIERTWGAKKFGWFYMLAGLSGGVVSLVFNSSFQGVIVGASAAIYGLLVVYWVMFPDRFLYIYFLFPVKVKWAIPGFMVLGFLFGGANIAHLAHLGGAVFGLIYAKSDLRQISLTNKLKNLRHKKQEAKLQKNRGKAEETMKRVDAILDKINEVGLENLSREERKFLDEASSELSDKTP